VPVTSLIFIIFTNQNPCFFSTSQPFRLLKLEWGCFPSGDNRFIPQQFRFDVFIMKTFCSEGESEGSPPSKLTDLSVDESASRAGEMKKGYRFIL
jgi:hypothetical protein